MMDMKPSIVKQENWDKMNDKGIALIRLNLFDYMLMNVSGKTRTKKLWDKLDSLYEAKFLMNIISLQKLYALKMKDGAGSLIILIPSMPCIISPSPWVMK